MSLPYFPLYPTDFEADTSHLTLAEDGAYNRLLRLCWMTPGCKIPDDETWIMRRMRAHTEEEKEAVRAVLAEFFTTSKQSLSNARLMLEHEKANDKHKKRVEAGKLGGEAKASKAKGKQPSKAKAMPKQCPSNQNQNQNHNIPPNPQGGDGDFDTFWQECPRKTNKGAARKAFAKAVKTTPAATIIQAMQTHAKAVQGKDQQFIPHPSTWLNGERWDDEGAEPDASGYEARRRAAEQWL